MPSKRKKSDKKEGYIWTFFVAFLFIGLGLGMFFNQAAAGVLLGMGIGFLVSAYLGLKKK